MKKALILLFVFCFSLLLFAGCSDDDWAPYTNKDYKITTHINSNIFVINDVKEELTQIVSEYSKDIPLTFAYYKLYSEDNGSVEFEFYKPYENGANRAILITVYIDLSTNNILKINYQDGHGKRVREYSNEIINTANDNILDYYRDTVIDNNISDNSYVSVIVSDKEIITNRQRDNY